MSRIREVIGLVSALLLALLVTSCDEANQTRADSSRPSLAPVVSATPPTPASTSQPPRVECRNRPAEDEIFARYTAPEGPATAQRLGGGWAWDEATAECVTSVEFVLRTNPAGSCTQVGRVSRNRGYDPDARPARPLKHVEKQRGDC